MKKKGKLQLFLNFQTTLGFCSSFELLSFKSDKHTHVHSLAIVFNTSVQLLVEANFLSANHMPAIVHLVM